VQNSDFQLYATTTSIRQLIFNRVNRIHHFTAMNYGTLL